MDRKLLAVQLAAESAKTIQGASILLGSGILWLGYSKGATGLSNELLWASASAFALSFLCSIWTFHNYIWALLREDALIEPAYQRVAFMLTYLFLLVGGATGLAFFFEVAVPPSP